ncbi:GNAT family N-acetyltransferase [Brackiella oedipodis]|uniref:GNAT family N-acetyltransferase n=1 Tax=Brackiella oedipodis TaxID=124225 RepID=UPI00048AC293|nr:GNAT family N-acetyltransferase [Brackiella oedipodis]
MTNTYQLRAGAWQTLREAASAVRLAVFVQEQQVPLELEFDAMDEQCLHVVAFDAQQQAVATGRLLPDGYIGRMAVLPAHRGTGLGSRVLQCLMAEGRRRGHQALLLSAQVQALAFYVKHGFVAEGQVYKDAGIDHKTMRYIVES